MHLQNSKALLPINEIFRASYHEDTGRNKFSTILVIGISLLFYIIIIIAFSADVYLLFIDTNSGLIWVSGKLPTCPSPKQTLTMLAKGRGRYAVSQTLKLISLSFFLGVVVRVS